MRTAMVLTVALIILLAGQVWPAGIEEIDRKAKPHLEEGDYAEAILIYVKAAGGANAKIQKALLKRIEEAASKLKKKDKPVPGLSKEEAKERLESWQGKRGAETLKALLQSLTILANKRQYSKITAEIDEGLRFARDSHIRQQLNAYRAAAKDLDDLNREFMEGLPARVGNQCTVMGMTGDLEAYRDGELEMFFNGMRKKYKLEKLRVTDIAVMQGWTREHGLHYKFVGEDLLLRGNMKAARAKFQMAKKKDAAVDNFLALYEIAKTFRYRDLYSRGEEFRGKKKYVEAVEEYRKALEIKPNDLGSLTRMAECFYAAKRYGEAAKVFATAEKLDPTNIAMQYTHAEALRIMKNYSSAAEQYRKVLSAEPWRYDAALHRARCLYSAKDYDKAISAFKKCVEMNTENNRKKDNRDPYRYLAWAHVKTGDVEGALAYHDKAIETSTGSYWIGFEKGRTLANNGRIEEGLKVCEEALSIATKENEKKSVQKYIDRIKEREKKKREAAKKK